MERSVINYENNEPCFLSGTGFFISIAETIVWGGSTIICTDKTIVWGARTISQVSKTINDAVKTISCTAKNYWSSCENYWSSCENYRSCRKNYQISTQHKKTISKICPENQMQTIRHLSYIEIIDR
jgi:hypothetical protein